MNFIVSKNTYLLNQYWNALRAYGTAEVFPDFAAFNDSKIQKNNSLLLIDGDFLEFFSNGGHIANLKNSHDNLKVLLIAEQLTVEAELSALALGISGCCRGEILTEKILQIFRTVEDGGVWISSQALPHLLRRLTSSDIANTNHDINNQKQRDILADLTPREREIAQHVARGDCNKIVARQLNISDRTVKSHLSIIFRKLKVNDRLQLAVLVNK